MESAEVEEGLKNQNNIKNIDKLFYYKVENQRMTFFKVKTIKDKRLYPIRKLHSFEEVDIVLIFLNIFNYIEKIQLHSVLQIKIAPTAAQPATRAKT